MRFVGVDVVNYRLTRKLGEGGFGEVYLAEHLELGRKAACKILFAEYARREDLVERFFREAKAVCAIGHRAIIDIQNFGRLPSGEPYYLMEYFPGRDLSERLRDRGAFSFAEIPGVFDPIADALMAAHANGVIHRDLKPENIMVREVEGRIVDVKLLDFGIAKLMAGDESGKSRTGMTMGTPTFMAPEQARDAKNVDQRADVYGFAATIFAGITGRAPFIADNVTDIIVAVQTQVPPRLSAFRSDVSPVLDEAMARCLAKRPEDRPPDVRAAWTAIRDALLGSANLAPHLALPLRSAGMATPETTLGAAAATLSGPRERGGRGRVIAIAGGGVLCGLIAIAAIVGGGPDEAPRAAGQSVAGAVSGTDASATTTTPPPARSTAPAAAATPPAPVGASTPGTEVAPPPPPDAVAPPPAAASATPPPTQPAEEPARPRAAPDQPPAPAVAAHRTMERTTPSPRKPHRAPAHPVAAPADKPRRDCSNQGFAVTYRAPQPAADEVRAALKRLKQCHDEGLIDSQQYRSIQRALIAKL